MVLIIIFAISVAIVYIVWKYNSVWQYSEKLKGKTPLPIIGNAHQFGSSPASYLQTLCNLSTEYEYNIFRAWFGPELHVFLTKPEDVEVILSSNKYLDKANDYRFLHDWIGNGLITSTGATWHTHRKLITSSFHFKILHDFHEVISKGANRLVEKFEEVSKDNKTFNAQDIVNLATLDVICETAMGITVNALDDPESELVTSFHDVSTIVFRRIFSAWKRFDFLFSFTKEYKMNKKALAVLLTFNKEVIHKRRELLAENKITSESMANISNSENNKVRRALLDTLLTSTIDGIPLSDKEIADEVSTFVFAGHDTTAASISFAIYHLSIHQKEQNKLLEEQKIIFGKDILKRDATYADIQNMQNLDHFVKESQRLIPAVPFISRMAKEQINLNGTIIPVGANVSMFLFAMGHNPNVFSNPTKFDPNRFSQDERQLKNPYEYVPFSAGPRNCIGQKFAILEIKTVLSKLVRHFEILPSEKPFTPICAASATTRSDNGIFIRLKKRNLQNML